MNYYLQMARKIAIENDNEDFHRLCAVVVKGGSVLSKAINLSRQGRCAERRALRPHLDLRGCTLYVSRSNGRVSKPCGACMEAIVEAGVKWLVYVNAEQVVEVVRV